MDHLPRPKNPVFRPLRIPYLGADFPEIEYDGLGLEGFLERLDYASDTLFQDQMEHEQLRRSLCALQSWCFIGLCIEFFRVFGIRVRKADLLCFEVDAFAGVNRITVSTRKLEELLVMLEERTRGGDDDDDDGLAEDFIIVDGYLTMISDVVSEMNLQNLREIERPFCDQLQLTTDLIHLSVLLMCETLEIGTSMINFYRGSNLGTSIWLKEQLLAAGWCRSEAFSLLNQEGTNTATVLYLCQMDRHSLRRGAEHRLCGDSFRCTRENLDHSAYKTRHSKDCRGEEACDVIPVDFLESNDILNIVLANRTPLVAIHTDPQRLGSSRVEIHSVSQDGESALRVQYVCISHVWSE
jgi:hypothetical protein